MIKVSFADNFAPSKLKAWTVDGQRDINKRVRRAMFETKPKIEQTIAAEVSRGLAVKRPGFAKSFKGYIQYADDSRLPVMAFASKVRWIGVHAEGASIGPRQAKGMMIPIGTKVRKNGSGRIGYKAWQRLIQQLAEAKALRFVKRGGSVIVFAPETLNGSRRHLGRHAYERSDQAGPALVPIAVYVPRVRLEARVGLAALASGPLGQALRQAVAKNFK